MSVNNDSLSFGRFDELVKSASLQEEGCQSNSPVKFHEAEDALAQNVFPLRKTELLPDLRIPEISKKMREIRKRDAVMWECVDRIEAPKSGYLYQYRLRDEYRNFEQFKKKSAEIYPAIEKPGGFLRFLSTEYKIKKDEIYTNPLRTLGEDFRSLGYLYKETEKGSFLTLPDRDALIAAWEVLQQKYHDLPMIEVSSSEGIADDISFALTHMHADLLLSKGREFVHDHTIHAIAKISRMILFRKKLVAERYRIFTFIEAVYRRLCFTASYPVRVSDEMEKLMNATLGILVDSFSSYNCNTDYAFHDQFIDKMLDVWKDDEWNNYGKKRFNEDFPEILSAVKRRWSDTCQDLKEVDTILLNERLEKYRLDPHIHGNKDEVIKRVKAAFESLEPMDHLDLSRLSVTALPPEIAQLTSLTSLNVSNNALTYLPPQMVRLSKLKSLNLQNNGKFEKIPSVLLLLNGAFSFSYDDQLYLMLEKHFPEDG